MMASGSEIERALERLYRTRYRALCRMATAVTGDLDRGHEAVQEGFARAYAARDQFAGAGPLEAWVWRIILRTAWRPAASQDQLPDDVSVSLPFPERNEELAGALAALPPRRRLILFLRYYADLSLRDIADTLGIAEGTVSATLTQARAELRAALDEHARRVT
jgi:RNA polymerase sigma factor (sigma-70 family)